MHLYLTQATPLRVQTGVLVLVRCRLLFFDTKLSLKMPRVPKQMGV